MKGSSITFLVLLFLTFSISSKGQRLTLDTKNTVVEDRGEGNKLYFKNLDVFVTKDKDWLGPRVRKHVSAVKSKYSGVGWAPQLDTGMLGNYIFFLDTTWNTPFKKDSVYSYEEYRLKSDVEFSDPVRFLFIEKYDTALGNYRVDTMNITDTARICYCADKYYGNAKGMIVGYKIADIDLGGVVGLRSYFYLNDQVFVISDSVETDYKENDTLFVFGHKFFRDYQTWVFANPDANLKSTDTHTIVFKPHVAVNQRASIQVSLRTGVFIQPHTELKGSIYDKTNGQRHRLIMDIEDGDVCLSAIIDLLVDDDDVVRYNGGHINFMGKRSCIMFKDRARLQIAKDKHLHYGNSDLGVLGMKPGTTIEFEDGAEMTVNNTLLLSDYWSARSGGEIDITLGPGNSLNFGEHASVTNGPFHHGSVVMNVHLKGGRVDLSQLDERSKELINLVEYEAFAREVDEAKLYPNPAQTAMRLSFVSDASTSIVTAIYQSNGATIRRNTTHVEEGANTLSIDVSGLEKGVYLMHLQFPDRVVAKTFLVN